MIDAFGVEIRRFDPNIQTQLRAGSPRHSRLAACGRVHAQRLPAGRQAVAPQSALQATSEAPIERPAARPDQNKAETGLFVSTCPSPRLSG